LGRLFAVLVTLALLLPPSPAAASAMPDAKTKVSFG